MARVRYVVLPWPEALPSDLTDHAVLAFGVAAPAGSVFVHPAWIVVAGMASVWPRRAVAGVDAGSRV